MATRFALTDGSSTHHAMTLLKVASAVLTTVRLSKARPEGSTPDLLRGTLH